MLASASRTFLKGEMMNHCSERFVFMFGKFMMMLLHVLYANDVPPETQDTVIASAGEPLTCLLVLFPIVCSKRVISF